MLSASEQRALIIQTVKKYLEDTVMAEVRAVSIQAGYVSGNPTLQLGKETSTSQGTKTFKIPQPYSNRNGLPSASQKTLMVSTSERRDHVPVAPLVDLANLKVDADYIMGLRPVAPGNTAVSGASHAGELSTTSAAYVAAKEFGLTRPGSYRVTLDLARSGGTARVKLAIVWAKSTGLVMRDASSEVTLSAGAAHPTTFAQTVDMNVGLPWGGTLLVMFANDSGPAQTTYVSNIAVKYSDATASMTPLDFVHT